MAEPVSRAAVQIADWPGLVSNQGPTAPPDAPGSAVEQVNLQSNVPGQLGSRPGFRKVQFDEES